MTELEELLGSPLAEQEEPPGELYAALDARGQRYVDLVCEGSTKLAAIRAVGNQSKPWSAYRMFAKYEPAIAERRAWLARQSNVHIESIASEHVKMAFANPQDFLDADGSPIPLHLLPRHVAAAVASFEVTETEVNAELKTRTFKYKMQPKGASLDALVKLFGLEAPKKVAFTDTEGNYVPAPDSDLDAARRIAFVLAQGARARTIEAEDVEEVDDPPV